MLNYPSNTKVMTSFEYYAIKNEYTNGKFVTIKEYKKLIRKIKLNQLLKNEI